MEYLTILLLVIANLLVGSADEFEPQGHPDDKGWEY